MKAALDPATAARLSDLLHDAAGLVVEAGRGPEGLAYAVGERLAATGCRDLPAYLALLAGPDGAVERQRLIDEVTIPETHFFRNPPQMAALRRQVLPELLRYATAKDRSLTVWSAGCSTGEEPYTLAMMLHELMPLADAGRIRVVGTDISERALAAAREARYGARALQTMAGEDIDRFLVREGRTGPGKGRPSVETWRVRDEVRALVTLDHHNLVGDEPPFGPGEVDLVLCRNVTIYFDRETTRALIARLHGVLRDGGYLVLGHAETLWQLSEDFRLLSVEDAFVYRRGESTAGTGTAHPAAASAGRALAAWAALTKPRTFPRPRQRPAPAPAPAPEQPSAGGPSGLSAIRTALAAGDYSTAADLAAALVVQDPLNPDAHYLRGLALVNQGCDGEALEDLRRAVYVDPKAGFAHFLLAGSLSRTGQLRAAVASYRAAADTLGTVPPGAVAAELGGRSAAELADLCRSLADRLEEEAS